MIELNKEQWARLARDGIVFEDRYGAKLMLLQNHLFSLLDYDKEKEKESESNL
jgi:hypothetical protein